MRPINRDYQPRLFRDFCPETPSFYPKGATEWCQFQSFELHSLQVNVWQVSRSEIELGGGGFVGGNRYQVLS